MIVLATREGLVGGKTSNGDIIDNNVPLVALPSREALSLWINIKSIKSGKSTKALVLDTGPWNIHDNAYVFGGARPQAETGKDLYGRITNKAGIDLGEKVWNLLEMEDNGEVDWEFV